ncbi:DUF4276 family protein [Dickeya dianthicola]|uniref:DUF4276 family protein n=1 Tax=Dickeya dianthicola TaxID=204039 RepID=UPI0024170438|nr:DUF4276 family protein [Dickeya dianthicola]
MRRRLPATRIISGIDYYGLPTDFPGHDDNPVQNADIYVRIGRLEQAFKQDINQPNFLANFIVHEYEALLFCQPEKFIDWIDDGDPVKRLLAMKAEFSTPEKINNSPQTAPSKRIRAVIPTYKKTLHGPLIAADIGLDSIRQQCPHFHSWLQCIEALAD